MTPEEQAEKVIRLDEQYKFIQQQMSENKQEHTTLDDKLDKVLVAIIQADANREADIVSLKISLKNKINKSMEPIVNDIEAHIRKTKWTELPNKYPKTTLMLVIAFFMSIAKSLYWVYEYKDHIKELIETLPS